MNELSENELKLTVSKKELGVLETNAQVLKDKIMEIIPKYNSDNYSPATIDKADKKVIITMIFDENAKELKDILTLDKIIDENVKELKNILTLDKTFDEKWLNKGSWEKEIFKLLDELLNKIDMVRSDLITISSLKSKYEIELKSDYLNNFKLGDVIRKNNTLLENEQLLKKQNDESKVVVEEQKVEKMVEMANTVVETKVIEESLTYTLEITAETSKMEALKIFLQTNNMRTMNVKTGKIIVE